MTNSKTKKVMNTGLFRLPIKFFLIIVLVLGIQFSADLYISVRSTMTWWIIIPMASAIAFLITFYTVPAIVKVSNSKNLFAAPIGRSSHNSEVPNLGGIAIFLGFILASILIAGVWFTSDVFYILAGLLIVLFIGLRDDLLALSAEKKFTLQLFAVFVFTIFAEIRVDKVFFMFKSEDFGYLFAILFTAYVFLLLINGFNLIDGIDGLASGVGMLASLAFGIFFLRAGLIVYSAISFSLLGSLMAFFIFNFFGTRNKIFLGDTGSMLIGTIISILAVKFINLRGIQQANGGIAHAPIILFGILIIPVYDTLRVFTLRILQGRSPFSADRQHIHHKLLDLGLSHRKATLILLGANIFFIFLSYFFQKLGNIQMIIIILSLCIIMSSTLSRLAAIYSIAKNPA